MPYVSLNPATNRIIKTYVSWDSHQLADTLMRTAQAQAAWRLTSLPERAQIMQNVGNLLRERRDTYAALITMEMGKLAREAKAEIEKCALGCDYYALHAAHFLDDEPVETDASKSYVSYQPLGTILGIMPWNFPFWQVFRFAVPCLMAGNAVALKHASNVPQCALAIADIFKAGGFPADIFATLLIEADQVVDAIASPHVQAVTLTGSEPAGRKVAMEAGRHLKKCVLELGGSDAFIVLHDADLELAYQTALASRFLNCGQSCIAAKRIIVVPEIADRFVALCKDKIKQWVVGDPEQDTTQIGPMARLDLREEFHRQVTDSIAQGAQAACGAQIVEGDGTFYQPTLLDHVTPKTRAYHEELFGPAACVIRAQDEGDAIRIANETRFGLGSSLWSKDIRRAEALSKEIQAGCTFINGMVKSDPRLPFGGIKASGFGRELSYYGLREFLNAKTIWVK